MKTASIPSSRKPSRRHLRTSKGKSPKKESLQLPRIVPPKVGSYPRCFGSCRISSKLDTSRRPLRRLRTTSIAQFKNARKGSVRSASAARDMSVSASMSEGLLTSRPIRTTRTCSLEKSVKCLQSRRCASTSQHPNRCEG